ncbi:uncharacterized protein TRIADDRAFT_19905 [Trichoplax adhaerens]|uniref:Exostosin GT47 domain-containing protein n=1 Tax=Trichoplax adhaerens TaxID=10228 RepID=B3RIL7_TRIAD|nr:hypothetical protein TRIADDRAFT_19905 [Trichoplax adhaerens]EDV29740.1 hypothetical protein TRIADDRAFT_19905 [Trichoplax adhaerens]|eukprot:XP_002108942.1 hypothetical protein TRIADDRAFT_19905 [Trichoplax adhaerens]
MIHEIRLKRKQTIPNFDKTNKTLRSVEIWGKAAIGEYLWRHVFNETIINKIDERGAVSVGTDIINDVGFKFLSGPGIIQQNSGKDSENVILILNGRSSDKIKFAKTWLEHLPSLKKLRNVALVMLGNERCDNKWIDPYVNDNRYKVRIVHLVYDDPRIDQQKFYQWPLGVATYRGFPLVSSMEVDITSQRRYICNFLGTVYNNSTRQKLQEIFLKNSLGDICYSNFRPRWLSMETKASSLLYQKVLRQSDITLCPIGFNSETYRIYEACSLGSIPVIEDVVAPGNCDSSLSSSPFRLLKKLKAPFIFIKDWSELPAIIRKESAMSENDKIIRRKLLLHWYHSFKIYLRNHYIKTIKENFF